MRDREHDMFLGADGHLFALARQLRLHETGAERLLWSRLCNNQLGVKFRIQHPIYAYVVDFYCHSCRLVIEVDGLVHSTRESEFNDSVRTKAFTESNIEVIRFTNHEVLFEIENVLSKVRHFLRKFHQEQSFSKCINNSPMHNSPFSGPGGSSSTMIFNRFVFHAFGLGRLEGEN